MMRGAVLAGLVAAAGVARASDDEPFRLDVIGGYQAERFNSPVADSLGLATTLAWRVGATFDFRVMSLPMSGSEKPSLHVLGGGSMTRRTIADHHATNPGQPPLEEVPISEFGTAIELKVPLAMVDRRAGAEFYVGYEGGLMLANAGSRDFLRTKRVFFGFERSQGFFEGTRVEMAYGRDESYGMSYAAGRWTARFHIRGALARILSRTPPKPVAKGAAPPPATPPAAPLHLFVDLAVDTDGGVGPDGIRGQAGVVLNAGSVLRRIMELTN